DLSALAGIDFVVVDAIACLERSKTAERKNGVITNLVRMNTILAGADPVAIDHVCARLMGLNPDDMEHITLAERVGLGTNQAADIRVVGADIARTARRFIKSTAKTGDYGQGNRDWILSHDFSIDGIDDPIDHPFLPDEAQIAPQPGRDGWSEPLYFTDDRIDLRNYFDNRRNIVSYACTYFDAPKALEAELWLGSDEAMKIWLNGEIVYDYNKTRTFADDDLYLEKVTIAVNAGENRLLVKTLHKFSRYDFSLNICEPEADSRYDGNRIWGLKFKTSSAGTVVQNEAPAVISDFQVGQAFPNPFNHHVRLSMQCGTSEDVTAAVYNVRGEKVKTLLHAVERGDNILFWDGKSDENEIVSSGLYFIQIHHANQVIIRKISLVR
ncbi:T9SS type A sorting domain-containing protein, partial [candidate division KSB1 bacterium]|nr:T9SS type A sorting domain-containing protein [candidate division KSB1 bacterium]